MKNNTSQVKNLLAEAMRALPHDFALGQARSYIGAAINEIKTVEGKRAKREEVQKTPTPLVSMNPLATIDILNKLIEEEKKVVEERRREQKEKESQSQDFLMG